MLEKRWNECITYEGTMLMNEVELFIKVVVLLVILRTY